MNVYGIAVYCVCAWPHRTELKQAQEIHQAQKSNLQQAGKKAALSHVQVQQAFDNFRKKI